MIPFWSQVLLVLSKNSAAAPTDIIGLYHCIYKHNNSVLRIFFILAVRIQPDTLQLLLPVLILLQLVQQRAMADFKQFCRLGTIAAGFGERFPDQFPLDRIFGLFYREIFVAG